MNFVGNIKYKHLYGTEHPKTGIYYNLKPSSSSMDSHIIACSEKFWACPWQGGGGPVYVSSLSSFGKVEPTCSLINGHKSAVLDLAFSPFHSELMVTASDDSSVKLWNVDNFLSASDNKSNYVSFEGDAVSVMNGHTHSVRTCNFHPTIDGLLVTTSMDLSVKLFDIHNGSEVASINPGITSTSLISNISFNYDGSVIVASCKDRSLKFLDIRTKSVVLTSPAGKLDIIIILYYKYHSINQL